MQPHIRIGAQIVVLASSTISAQVIAQEQAAPSESEVAHVVVTGTRVANRSALDTAVPVDVVSADVLQSTGGMDVNQALSEALPSFNFPRPGLADATDTIRPATLRGLSPDQTLVLVNGKRRHASSLVNVNGTIGRGAAAVDLNTIPVAMIESVEVLRDGASAQYGSDAIAGVINLRLRQARDGGNVTAEYGWRDTEYKTVVGPAPAGATWSAPSTLSRSRSDGETLTVSGWKGLSLGDTGSVTIAAEYKDQEHTERGGWDTRQQYPLAGGALDHASRRSTAITPGTVSRSSSKVRCSLMPNTSSRPVRRCTAGRDGKNATHDRQASIDVRWMIAM